MLKACLKHLDEKYYCPYCKQQLTCCNAPPFHVGDGLGWGSEYLYICLNDECPLFVSGWQHVEEKFGHRASYRHMMLPGEKNGTPMMVASPDAFKGCEVDPESIRLQSQRYAREKAALQELDTCVAAKNPAPVLTLVLDEAAGKEGRNRACELLVELNDLTCLDPIRNHHFNDASIEQAANMAIARLLKANFKKECPYCSEIIKAQAKVCRHCGKEL